MDKLEEFTKIAKTMQENPGMDSFADFLKNIASQIPARREQSQPSPAESKDIAYQPVLASAVNPLPRNSTITQRFGNINPIEKFSGGFNRGTDFSYKANTPLIAPQGNWIVDEAYSSAKPDSGYLGNGQNLGWGNSVVLRNQITGERVRMSHLNGVNVKPGQIISGGQQVGMSGNTGNSSGYHLDVEYIDPEGKLGDITKTNYSSYF